MDDAEKRELSHSFVNIKDHFEMLFRERGRQIDLRFAALSDALILASGNVKEKLNELNNLRREYTDDRTKDQEHYVKSDVYYPKMKEIETWKAGVDKSITTTDTRYQGRLNIATLVSALSLLLAVVSMILMFIK